jgi:hypothetical protein
MENVIRFGGQEDLLGRDKIELELPRFLVRAFEEQVAKANADASEEERVSLNDCLELHLAEHLSIAEVAGLERDIPGIAQPSGAG